MSFSRLQAKPLRSLGLHPDQDKEETKLLAINRGDSIKLALLTKQALRRRRREGVPVPVPVRRGRAWLRPSSFSRLHRRDDIRCVVLLPCHRRRRRHHRTAGEIAGGAGAGAALAPACSEDRRDDQGGRQKETPASVLGSIWRGDPARRC